MGRFATGVTIITTEVNGEVHGMTANAFMSVSLEPKLVQISVADKAKMLKLINESGKYAVNILSEDQQEMSMLFAGQIKEERDVQFETFEGLPIIKDSLVSLACKVYDHHVAGDHTLFIGEVMNLKIQDGNPLTIFEGKYKELV
ncbi:flavin reductase family protein [Salipaludibacillus sp. CF4.18]|uniref:flavin reductase family protein n=1 Tax=Salipaludibacillus sp. CF4.18 TaxID=3373081 RepID=UPI003EE45FAB